MSNYATKADLKDATIADSSDFAKKVQLANLISDLDKLHIHKLETTRTDLSKPSNVVKT